MSYTAPQYVDTKEQAVLALASTIADEDKSALGDGSVNRALDVLADVLAEQDVQVPQTDAGAILALAQYASGMVKPEGTIAITENGEGIDVAQYATADVSVSGGGAQTTDVYLWNALGTSDNGVAGAGYMSGGTPDSPVLAPLEFEAITEEHQGTPVYGVKVKDAPAGSYLFLTPKTGYVVAMSPYVGYSAAAFPPGEGGGAVPMPMDGLVTLGAYAITWDD